MKYVKLLFYEPELIFNESNSNSTASHSYHTITMMICFAISEDVFQLHKLQQRFSSAPERVPQLTWANGQEMFSRN